MAGEDRSGVYEDEDDRRSATAVLDGPVAPAEHSEPPPSPFLGKLSKRERKALKDQQRPLGSWERYRALTDVLEEAMDLVDLADHKARFALVVMGALNALLFVLASMSDVFDAIPPSARATMTVVIVIYTLVALYFVLQAIESLRPRRAQPYVRYVPDRGPQDHPLGLRFYEDVMSRSVDEYRAAWRDLRMGQLNSELAVQAHAMAQINKAKYAALRRLYLGLQVMTIMAVMLMAVGSYFVLSGKARAMENTAEGMQLFGLKIGGGALPEPVRLGNIGVAEPSGVAVDQRSGNVYVAGDEGKFVELDRAGQLVRSRNVPGNLEDVAIHEPTGFTVLLAEDTSELIVLSRSGMRQQGRWKLDHDAILGQRRTDLTQGFEGLAFRPDKSLPGGGIFYLTHQHEPALLIALAFTPNLGTGTLGAAEVKGRWPLGKHADLTAVTYSAELDRLLVIAEVDDRLLIVRTDGTLERDVPLPGQQQEGIALDSTGTLWIADDKDKALLKIEGALEALRPRSSGIGTGLRIPG